MKTTFPKGTPVVYHLFDGEFGHKEEYGVFIDNLTNRRCIVRFEDRIEAVDKDWLMKRDGMEYLMKRILEDDYFKTLFSKEFYKDNKPYYRRCTTKNGQQSPSSDDTTE